MRVGYYSQTLKRMITSINKPTLAIVGSLKLGENYYIGMATIRLKIYVHEN